jgi:hypothetical protein
VVSQRIRAVPTVEQGWLNDGLDVCKLLCGAFEPQAEGKLSAANTTEVVANASAWAAYRRR